MPQLINFIFGQFQGWKKWNVKNTPLSFYCVHEMLLVNWLISMTPSSWQYFPAILNARGNVTVCWNRKPRKSAVWIVVLYYCIYSHWLSSLTKRFDQCFFSSPPKGGGALRIQGGQILPPCPPPPPPEWNPGSPHSTILMSLSFSGEEVTQLFCPTH